MSRNPSHTRTPRARRFRKRSNAPPASTPHRGTAAIITDTARHRAPHRRSPKPTLEEKLTDNEIAEAQRIARRRETPSTRRFFVVLGLITLDKKTMGWTVYSSLAPSTYTMVFVWLIPLAAPLTNDTLLELSFAVLLPAIGSALVFNIGASTGGTDILAMILRKHSSLEIGKALLLVDATIVGTALVLFGPRTGLCCFLVLIGKSFIVDTVIESVNQRKVCTVINEDPEMVLEYLVKDLRRTATIREERGGFTGRRETVLVSVLSRSEARKLRVFLRENDPDAFITIVSSSEIVGRGFRGV